jgi:hypothetical protein
LGLYTPYHTKYFAYELTGRFSSDKLEKLAGTFAGAQVDLNPHQVDAALVAFVSTNEHSLGQDDYSLKSENLPQTPLKPGQLELNL